MNSPSEMASILQDMAEHFTASDDRELIIQFDFQPEGETWHIVWAEGLAPEIYAGPHYLCALGGDADAAPLLETRNRNPLRPNETSQWELRIGKYRVFYDVPKNLYSS